jgi:hypothetical protein
MFLETAAGYFSLVDLASNHALPGSLMAEFPHIARQYYWSAQNTDRSSSAVVDVGLGSGALNQHGNVGIGHDQVLVCFLYHITSFLPSISSLTICLIKSTNPNQVS